VGSAIEWADDITVRAGAPERVRQDFQVCLEEALANLIMHGKAAAEKEIGLTLIANESGVEAYISDRCVPFDVTTAHIPKADAARTGGVGMRLLRTFASELSYESGATGNMLRLTLRA
jgi:anti-sigma regulatory factor (Ser/Thr protein kinase)